MWHMHETSSIYGVGKYEESEEGEHWKKGDRNMPQEGRKPGEDKEVVREII